MLGSTDRRQRRAVERASWYAWYLAGVVQYLWYPCERLESLLYRVLVSQTASTDAL